MIWDMLQIVCYGIAFGAALGAAVVACGLVFFGFVYFLLFTDL